MKSYLSKIRFFLICFLCLLNLFNPSPVQAQITEWTATRMDDNGNVIQSGNGCLAGIRNTNDAGTAYFEAATIKGVECLVQNILATATTIIGLISFVMVLVGAFYYLTSGGNSSTIELGKKSITYGIIGIIVSLLAYFILVLIADFTGVDTILKFNTQVGGN